jgi:hypothetical protein
MAVDHAAFAVGDVYIDFPYEEVFFRFEKATGKVFRKFYGESGEIEIPRDNKLYSEGRIAGSQVSAICYANGRPRRAVTLCVTDGQTGACN